MVHLSFDLDGTLIDSLPLMKKSWENCSARLGLEVDWIDYRKNIGLPFRDICRNLDLTDHYAAIKEMYFSFNKENADLVEPMDGLSDLIEWLEVDGISWSIITSKPSVTAFPLLEKFGLRPQCVITSDDIARGKPNPMAGEKLIREVGCDNVFYIGDSLVDHLFAINCKFEFVRCKFDGREVLVDDISAYDMIRNHHHLVTGLGQIRPLIKKISK